VSNEALSFRVACARTRGEGGTFSHWPLPGVELLASLAAAVLLIPLSVRRALVEREEVQRAMLNRDLELQRARQDNERLHKELDKLAYVTAHDLRAPLRSIENLATWIEEGLGDEVKPETLEHLRLLHGRVHRMESLIDGILQFARAGRAQKPPGVVDVGGLVASVVDFVKAPPSCRIEVVSEMPVLLTHGPELQQVFTNLITNAVRHARRPDPTIRVAARDLGWAYEFSVSDDGQGIQPRFHQRIFEIFTTLEARDKEENTGMGLAVVKKIVETVGGAVRVESQEGRGSSFIVTWPKDLTCGEGFAPPASSARPSGLAPVHRHE
jgi:light-regulated signal transduction histidine kinase (bacteriophytochrome)